MDSKEHFVGPKSRSHSAGNFRRRVSSRKGPTPPFLSYSTKRMVTDDPKEKRKKKGRTRRMTWGNRTTAFRFCFRRVIYAARVRLLTRGMYIGFPLAAMHHRYALNVTRHLVESEILFTQERVIVILTYKHPNWILQRTISYLLYSSIYFLHL